MIKSLFVIEEDTSYTDEFPVSPAYPDYQELDRLSEMRICNVAAQSTSDLITIRG